MDRTQSTASGPRQLSIVIPVYFNAATLPALFQELQGVEADLQALGLALQLVFVNDGSGDDSQAELLKIKACRPATRIIKHTRNFGAIRAIKTGYRYVTGDCFTILAADLQDPPHLIVDMARHWLNGAKYVVCERESRDDPWSSRMMSWIYYRLVHLFVSKDFPSGGYDLALMDKAMLPYLVNSSKSAYIHLLAFWLGFQATVIKYHRQKRMHGRSRWTVWKKLNASVDAIAGFSITPVRLMTAGGLVVALCSFLYGAFQVVRALVGRSEVPGFASLASLVSFSLGLNMVMLGVVAEYMWRIFLEVNPRPESVVEEEL